MKRLHWTVARVGVAAVALVWLVAWRSPPFYDAPRAALPVPILVMAEYDKVSQAHAPARTYICAVARTP